jgi:hypothetical protein
MMRTTPVSVGGVAIPRTGLPSSAQPVAELVEED